MYLINSTVSDVLRMRQCVDSGSVVRALDFCPWGLGSNPSKCVGKLTHYLSYEFHIRKMGARRK